jgi:hypothetical protein
MEMKLYKMLVKIKLVLMVIQDHMNKIGTWRTTQENSATTVHMALA